MKTCERCGQKVPDFLWNGDDHPVLSERPITIHRDDLPNDFNMVKVTIEALIEKRMCSER